MKRKKRALTLLEILIVIFLITLITGAIGYNMKGTLDKGRIFRTEQAKMELHDLLMLCISEGKSPEEVCNKPEDHLKESGLAKDPKKLVKDGWGEKFKIEYKKGDIEITSAALEKHRKEKK